jgi:LPS-assembly lipoprotein
MSWSRRAVLAVALAAGGCGFQPLYGQRGGSSVGDHMAATRIGIIEDRTGQQLRNALLIELQPGGISGSTRYALDVKVAESISQLAVAKDETTSRSSLELRATYSLKRIEDGKVLFEGVSRAASSYNIVASNFATVSAEADARRRAVRVLGEDMKIQLGAYFNRVGS